MSQANMRDTFLALINETIPAGEYNIPRVESYDFNQVVNLTTDLITAASAYPENKTLSKLQEGVKSVLVTFKAGDEEVNKALTLVRFYVEELNRKDTVKRRWRRNTNAMLPIIAKRRYWRHKNKYKRVLQNWKEANSQKPFYDRLQKYAKAAFEERSRVYKEDVLYLMKAVSSAYTHFIIGLDHDMGLHEHVLPVTEIVTASLNDLGTCLDKLNESGGQASASDIYTNTLFFNAMFWTNINIDLIGGEDDVTAEKV